METVKVIVTKATKPTYWYAPYVGQVFECYTRTIDKEHLQVVYPINGGPVCFIFKEDCKVYNFDGIKKIKKLNFV